MREETQPLGVLLRLTMKLEIGLKRAAIGTQGAVPGSTHSIVGCHLPVGCLEVKGNTRPLGMTNQQLDIVRCEGATANLTD